MADTISCSGHCRACDRCFTSTKAFDLHRVGDYKDNSRRCADPSEVEKLAEGVKGVCKVQDRHTHITTVFGVARGEKDSDE